jgi:hypothetical protein
MRNELLRDVIAGSAGVLVVLAVIGLPKDIAAAPQPWQTKFLPYYSVNLQHSVKVPRPGPFKPGQVLQPGPPGTVKIQPKLLP